MGEQRREADRQEQEPHRAQREAHTHAHERGGVERRGEDRLDLLLRHRLPFGLRRQPGRRLLAAAADLAQRAPHVRVGGAEDDREHDPDGDRDAEHDAGRRLLIGAEAVHGVVELTGEDGRVVMENLII